MRYLSVCSGIEAATVAWRALGWTPAAFSEIDAFPRRVLAHHYPDVPLHGDFTTIKGDEYGAIDLLVGGTPCQDFSVAGKRAGLDGENGNLTLEYARLARRCGARWMVWENVPGAFSLNEGRDFGAVLACFAGHPDGSIYDTPKDGWKSAGVVPPAGPHGHGLAWRVFDAQYAGVPQRRRRIKLVGYLGDWRPSAAVLFERESLLGNPPPRREARESVAPTLSSRTRGGGGLGTDFDCDGGCIPVDLTNARVGASVSGTIDTGQGKGNRGQGVVAHAFDARQSDVVQYGDKSGPLDTDGTSQAVFSIMPQNSGKDFKARQVEIAQPVLAAGHGGGNMGGDVVLAFTAKDYGQDAGEIAPTLRSGTAKGANANGGVMPAVAFDLRGRDGGSQAEGPHDTANIRAGSGGSSRSYVAAPAVRRLTPRECERLQGLPDNYTRIPMRFYKTRRITALRPADLWDKVEGGWMLMAADGPRYKGLGNSMAEPVMRWIGERIDMVERVLLDLRGAA